MLDLQKATFSNRISAFLFDAILMFIAVVGFGMIFSGVVGYDDAYEKNIDMGYQIYEENGLDDPKTNVKKFDELVTKYDEFILAVLREGEYGSYKEFSVDPNKSHKDFSSEQIAEFESLVAMFPSVNAGQKAMADSKEYTDHLGWVYTLSVCNISISVFLGFLLLEFLVPLLFGNGQTIGKKVFGVAVIKVNGVKISTFQLFVRSILVKYTLETMVPGLLAFMILYNVFGLGLIGTAIILGLLISQIILYIRTETNSLIHDIVAVTVCVDIHSQMIFKTDEELIAYKEEQAAKAVGFNRYGAESEVNVYSSYASNYADANSTEEKETMGDDAYSSVNMGTLTLSDITIDDVADRDFFKSDVELDAVAEDVVEEATEPEALEESEESLCESDDASEKTDEESITEEDSVEETIDEEAEEEVQEDTEKPVEEA